MLSSLTPVQWLCVSNSPVHVNIHTLYMYICTIDAWALPRATYSMFHTEDLEVAR